MLDFVMRLERDAVFYESRVGVLPHAGVQRHGEMGHGELGQRDHLQSVQCTLPFGQAVAQWHQQYKTIGRQWCVVQHSAFGVGCSERKVQRACAQQVSTT